MSRNSFMSEMPYEKRIQNVFGSNWRNLAQNDIDGAWGIGIVSSVLDGVDTNLRELSSHLGVPPAVLDKPFRFLGLNGIFMGDKLKKDRKELMNDDEFVWCWYAGYASGDAGQVNSRGNFQGNS